MRLLAVMFLLLVSGCEGLRTDGQYTALQDSLKQPAKDHARALADCPSPECDRAILTGQTLLSQMQAGLWPE